MLSYGINNLLEQGFYSYLKRYINWLDVCNQAELTKDMDLVNVIEFLTNKTRPTDPREVNVIFNMANKSYVHSGGFHYEGEEVDTYLVEVLSSIVIVHLGQMTLDKHHDLDFQDILL